MFQKVFLNTFLANVEKVDNFMGVGRDEYLPILEPQLFCTQVGDGVIPLTGSKLLLGFFMTLLMVIQGREKYINAVICLSIYDTVFMF